MRTTTTTADTHQPIPSDDVHYDSDSLMDQTSPAYSAARHAISLAMRYALNFYPDHNAADQCFPGWFDLCDEDFTTLAFPYTLYRLRLAPSVPINWPATEDDIFEAFSNAYKIPTNHAMANRINRMVRLHDEGLSFSCARAILDDASDMFGTLR